MISRIFDYDFKTDAKWLKEQDWKNQLRTQEISNELKADEEALIYDLSREKLAEGMDFHWRLDEKIGRWMAFLMTIVSALIAAIKIGPLQPSWCLIVGMFGLGVALAGLMAIQRIHNKATPATARQLIDDIQDLKASNTSPWVWLAATNHIASEAITLLQCKIARWFHACQVIAIVSVLLAAAGVVMSHQIDVGSAPEAAAAPAAK